MIRAACVALAALTLGGCASMGAQGAIGSSIAARVEPDAAPVESVVAIASRAAAPLDRRLFSPPSRRQPDLRVILVTARDRARRHVRRRRRAASKWPTLTRRVFALALVAAPACATAQTPAPATQLFLFQYAPGPAWRAGAPMREQGLGPHGAYMQGLQDEGRLFAGGGYVNADGGMAIVIAADIEEARALLAADPAIVSGIFVAELRHWRPRFRTDQPLPATP